VVTLCLDHVVVYAGYLFGNIPWVKKNLTLIVLGIVVISLIPAATTFLRERRGRARAPR
jgi:membrane-associated protein